MFKILMRRSNSASYFETEIFIKYIYNMYVPSNYTFVFFVPFYSASMRMNIIR